LKSLGDVQELPAALEMTEEEIPVSRLGRDNPILWGGEVVLFEDELDDCGSSRCFVRVRAMADCFFIMLRHYLRVDDVVVRLCDTRLFHSYDSRYILREFQVKEAPYTSIMQALPRTWTTDANQSDMIFYVTQPQIVFRDRFVY
jgi:type 2A phosphatase activator TIP41